MTHSRTDDGDRYIVIPCRRRPTVARSIGSQQTPVGQHFRQAFEQSVVRIECCPVLLVCLARIQRGKYREQIGALLRGIAVDDALNGWLDAYRQQLSRPAAGITDYPVLQVAFAQIGDIHEGHTACAVAEDEQIAGECQRRAFGEFKPVKLCNNRF